jgi:hypothetical protein
MAKIPVGVPPETTAPSGTPTMSGNGHVTTAPATPVAIQRLLHSHSRDELIQRLSPQRKTLYERIQALRQEIGDSPIDIVATLGELREHA